MAHDSGLDDETLAGGTPDDFDYYEIDCPICGAYTEYVDCQDCDGEGGHHDCGEDTCCCLDKEEITVDCETCKGQGGYRECTALPHTEEQIAAYRSKCESET
jgi:hypothetical protein